MQFNLLNRQATLTRKGINDNVRAIMLHQLHLQHQPEYGFGLHHRALLQEAQHLKQRLQIHPKAAKFLIHTLADLYADARQYFLENAGDWRLTSQVPSRCPYIRVEQLWQLVDELEPLAA